MKGTTVGPYRVLDRIGGGGMGVVHEAEDTRLGRRVALKFLPPELTADAHALSRFRREARAASALNHPHICTLHDIAQDDGQVFLVMERLEGLSLKDALPPEGLPIARVLDVGVQIADALEAAHAKGIVHRDIKPSNLWVTTRGDIKVLDFGLAKRTRARKAVESDSDTATEDRDVTSAGAAVGTLGYMSPEQAKGEEVPRQSALLCISLPCASDARCPVWTVPVPRGTPRRLGDLAANTAAVSPGGESIVLVQHTARRLLLAASDGSGVQTLIHTPTSPWTVSWEPRGKIIRFSATGPPGHDGDWWIWETSVQGATPQPLYPGRRGDWTPDGRHFVFERWNESASRFDAFVVREKPWPPWARPAPVPLTNGPVSFVHFGPRPDGQSWFAFGTDRRAELLRFDRRLGRFGPFLGGSSVGFVDPSPDGEHLAWVSFPEEVLWQGRRDGSSAIPLTSAPLRAWMPRWSPDGKKIAFLGIAPDEPGRALRVVPAGGGEIEVLARPEKGLALWDPCWQPDGRSIVFGSTPWDSTSRLRVLDWTSRETSTLPGSQGLNGPKCGPQGQILATRVALPGKPLVVRWQDRAQWEDVPPALSPLLYPTWTRDGSFCGLDQSDRRIHCYSFKEGRYTTVADVGHTRLPSWVFAPWVGFDLDGSPMVMRDVSTMDLYALDWEAP